MKVIAIVFSLLVSSTVALAEGITVEADLLFDEYYFGENVSIGLLIANSSGQSKQAVITATSDLDPQYLLLPGTGARRGLVWSEKASVDNGEVITRVLRPFGCGYGWNKLADYDHPSIEFSVRVLVDVDGTVFERLINVTVNRPVSETGLELWSRFLAVQKFRYNYIGVGTLGDLVPEVDVDETAGSTVRFPASEYSEGFATETLATMSFPGWRSHLLSPDDSVDYRNLFQSKREIVGARRAYGIHPAECLALALSERTESEPVSNISAEVAECTRSNRYYSALAKALMGDL